MKIKKYPVISTYGNEYLVTIKRIPSKSIQDILVCKVYVKILGINVRVYRHYEDYWKVSDLIGFVKEAVGMYEYNSNKREYVHQSEEKFKQWNGDMRE